MTDTGEKSLELTAKMEKNFNKIGITLEDSTTGQLKSTFDIMKELSEVYPTLDKDTKNYYSALIGGKTQVDVVNSIISNFSTALGANEEAINSAGSAMRENQRYIESIAGHIAVLKSEFQLLSQGLSGEFIKNILDVATGFLQLANNIGLAPIVVGLLSTAIVSMLIPAIVSINAGVISLNASLTWANVLMGGLPLAIGLATGALVYGSIALKEHNKQMALSNGQIKVNTKSYGDLKKELEDVNKTQNEGLVDAKTNQLIAEQYIGTIEDLSKKEELSVLEKEKLKAAVENLNGVIPDLNLNIDATTGKLTNNIAEVRTAANEYINLAKAQIYQASIAGKAKLLAENAISLEETRMAIEAPLGDTSNARLRTQDKLKRERAKSDYINLLKQSNTLNSDLDKAIENAKKYADKVGNASGVITDGTITDDTSGDSSGSSTTVDALKSVKEALDAYISSLEQELFLMEKQNATDEERIAFMQKIQSTIHDQSDYYRKLGLSETSDEIASLQNMWWKYADNIATIQKDALQKKATDLESAFSAVSKKAQDKISDLNDKRKIEEEYWDAKITALKSENDLIESNIALQEAQEAIARAKSNKVRVYREGQGFVYESDISAVSEAKKGLDKINREQQLKDEVNRLETLKKQATDSIDSQIKKWTQYSEKWSSVASDYKVSQDSLMVLQKLGIDTEKEGWEDRLGNAEEFVAKYKALMAQIGANPFGSVSGGTPTSTGGYNITSEKGIGIASGLKSGEQYKASDGSTWTKQPNGTVKVITKTGGSSTVRLASGTTNASSGLANVDEQGKELILRKPTSGRMTYMEKGDGVVSANLTKNLMEWGKFNPKSFVANDSSGGGGMSQIFNIDNLSLPNVSNAQELISGLSNLKTKAIQVTKSRV